MLPTAKAADSIIVYYQYLPIEYRVFCSTESERRNEDS